MSEDGGMEKETQRSTEMRQLVRDYEASGLARREFCEQRGISLTTFDYWRGVHGRKPRMVKVEVAGTDAACGFTLSLANGRRIESSWGFADAELMRLIRIAESA